MLEYFFIGGLVFNNSQKEKIGLLKVEDTVCVGWACGWQEYDHQNDDAFDGMIIMSRGQKRPYKTGGIVFVQVKCGGNGYRQDQAQHPDHLCLSLGREYIENHRPRWERVPGPAVLVFVDDTFANRPAWWVDLKLNTSYSTTNQGMILIPKSQRFSAGTKGIFHRLCGSGPSNRELETIELRGRNILRPKLGRNESIRNDAWAFYKDWRDNLEDRTNPNPIVGEVFVNRVGWKHMTRPGRTSERILQSWMLLPAAKEIIKTIDKVDYLGRASVTQINHTVKEVVDYLGLRATVTFPYRHHSVVQVVLRRSRLFEPGSIKTRVWFYSVYERRRGERMI